MSDLEGIKYPMLIVQTDELCGNPTSAKGDDLLLEDLLVSQHLLVADEGLGARHKTALLAVTLITGSIVVAPGGQSRAAPQLCL